MNAKLWRYSEFVQNHGLQDEDDDTIMLAMIHQLTLTISPRIITTDFPQTEYQAKFFIKNGTHPSHTFILNCSKDFS